jgi:Tfp pilus assembly protein PilO
MKSTLDKLNLRPHERRLLVVVLLLFFALLNWWFVWPFFGEWSKTSLQINRDRDTLKRYQAEIGRQSEYQQKLEVLQKTGSQMLTDELQFQRIVQNTAAASSLQNVNIDPRMRTASVNTNQFFQEQTLAVQFTSGGKELVDFLVNLAAENAMIRVREMNLKPDPSQTRLVANLVLVGNYQRKPSTEKVAAAPAARKKT